MRSKVIGIVSAVLVVLLLPLVAVVPAVADMGTWGQVNTDGFGNPGSNQPMASAVYKGDLYVGVDDTPAGCAVWRWNASTWTRVNAAGFGDVNNSHVMSMAEFSGFLYAGTWNGVTGCELWRTAGVGGPPFTDWTQVNVPGFAGAGNNVVFSLAAYGNYLYAGTTNFGTGCEVWRSACSGAAPFADWAQVNADGFGAATNTSTLGMTVFDSRLHVATSNGTTGAEIWVTAAAGGPPFTDWAQVNADGFGAAVNGGVESMVVKGSYLYAAVGDYWGANVSRVFRSTGTGGPPYTDWVQVNADDFGDPSNWGCVSLETDGSYLYAGTWNTTTGCQVWRSACAGGPPFTDWAKVNTDGFGDAGNTGIWDLPFYNNNLLALAENGASGAEVWQNNTLYPTWFLAEGSTAWGFDEYISIENPNGAPVTAVVTYMTTGGPVPAPNVALPALSQATVDPRAVLGDQDFSTQVTCLEGVDIAVDRTMSWTGPGAVSPEGHNSVGVTAPSTNWYLPEGSSEWGFECWLLIQNPNAVQANCQVTYMIEGAPAQTFAKQVPANARRTFNMAEDIGARDASIMVESDVPVIGERAMYRNDRREGHDSIGTTQSASDYFLAEGATAWGFTTYVLVQNPNPTEVTVNMTFNTSGGPYEHTPFTMPGNSRRTVRLNDIGPVSNTDLSTRVHGSLPIIAERAMYWDYGLGEACHDSIGMEKPHTRFLLPDGQSSDGRETWTLVQNPNNVEVNVMIVYLSPAGIGNVFINDNVPANSRKTYNMADNFQGRGAVVVLCTTSNMRIMVERAMYWNDRGAGTDTIGGYAD
ncbi:MAG: hypothetical protein V1748_13465 [Actinomycetota bacterium]